MTSFNAYVDFIYITEEGSCNFVAFCAKDISM